MKIDSDDDFTLEEILNPHIIKLIKSVLGNIEFAYYNTHYASFK